MSALAIVLTVIGGAGALAALYLLVLALAACAARRVAATRPAHRRLAVLVPAHDEAELVGRCIRSLLDQTYPTELYDVVVIADNCTDDTALVAISEGAMVMVRDEPDDRGKGQALRWAMDRLLVERPDVAGFVVVDADSVADPGMLAALAARLDAGAEAVQAEYLSLNPSEMSAREELAAAALLLFHRVRFRGRTALGFPCQLVGNGMLFSRALLERQPWSAFTSAEDLEYSMDLRLAGVRPAFAADGLVRGPMPAGGRAARTQRLRWEGGRFHVVRSRLPRLLRAVARGRLDLLDAVVDLAVPPLGLLGLLLAGGTALSAALAAFGGLAVYAVLPWLAGVVMLALFVLVGLAAAGAPRSTYKALLLAPLFVLGMLSTRLRLVRGLRETTWERTERPGDGRRGAEPGDAGVLDDANAADLARSPLYVEPEDVVDERERPVVAGVPIDMVDTDEAVRRAVQAIDDHRFMQVCTVNLDFLVHSRKDEVVHRILRESDLNVADGTPVLWLVRLLGHTLRGRVAGADFVPRLIDEVVPHHRRVFLLGGEDGTADGAARRLCELHPSLVIAGTYEPPRSAFEDMDHEEILRRVNEARPDIVLVALGHPKQEKWIHANRHRLPGCVAVGVGCTFDLLAGRRRRAPLWMQDHGLEWLYRVLREPRRLASRYLADALWLVAVLVPLVVQQRLLARDAVRVDRRVRREVLTK
jgi:exopolysaccharide biosynthesis WecB/TagA/CpsF family protein